ncbi:RNA polymerase sigma factor [Polystyrenella longa]|uniref:RNA polymerase sigma factor n=1 Tax=Polystyrenella longa TaxID=2528007 RepID=A0A518CU65_9PLAN|nr:sigma-70 family RNA polymerase sigma factor [Polystyrenella longa]QDU82773.1 RNA polymerase sigma factor [Polystyrenella longa]
MTNTKISQTTQFLQALSQGDQAASEKLLPIVYEELRRLASYFLKNERVGHTLQPTDLVHEAYLKLVNQDKVEWEGRSHFIAIAARQMRRILVDYARARATHKRGGDLERIPLDRAIVFSHDKPEDILSLEDMLLKLERLDERQAELVELRFYGGLTVEQAAKHLGISKRTAELEWKMIRAWFRKELKKEDG